LSKEFTRGANLGGYHTPPSPSFTNLETAPGGVSDTFAVAGDGQYRLVCSLTGNGSLSLVNSSGTTITTLGNGGWTGTLPADTYHLVVNGSAKMVAATFMRTN
jgi:hypothetical protein